MSFPEIIKGIADKAKSVLMKKQAEVDFYRSKMVNMSDNDIIRGCRNSTGIRRTAFMVEAKERGLMNQ